MENLIAIVKNKKIVNIIVASDEFAATMSEETINITGKDVGIGWGYSNGEFQHPDTFLSEDELLEKKTAEEKEWRDYELAGSDFIVPLTDHPQHEAYMTYRKALRDYPQQEDFPNGQRPIKP